MLAHRIGEVETALHVLAGGNDDLREMRVLLLRTQDFKALEAMVTPSLRSPAVTSSGLAPTRSPE
jgi:hypothetical protein